MLTITVACPGGDQSGSGTSGLTVTSVSGPGACTVTLSEPPTLVGPVGYTLTITPDAQ